MCRTPKSDTVDIIDPHTYKIIGHFALPKHGKGLLEPQHVVPSWDLKKLWVAQDLGDQLTMIDPATGEEGPTVHVDDPYNMYYTPDGKYAVVMAEREKRIDFRDAQTMKMVNQVPVNCEGVNHADFYSGRPLHDRDVRVFERTAQGRRRRAEGNWPHQARAEGHAAGLPLVAGRQGILRGQHGCRTACM